MTPEHDEATPEHVRFRRLVREHGHDATAEQTLNAGFRHWLAPDGRAGVAYAVGRTLGPPVWLAAGAPVGPADSRREALAGFETAAREAGARPAWFAVDGETVQHLGPGHAALAVGTQPVWTPTRWAETVAGHA